MKRIIDTHAHIFSEYYENIDEVMLEDSSTIVFNNAVDYKTSLEVLSLSKKYNNMYATIGVHPSEVNSFEVTNKDDFINMIKDDKVVALGEIGLDYHYGKENIVLQKEMFVWQLDVALKYNLPVIIHSRDAIDDTYEILSNYPTLIKVLHCYSGGLEYAKRFLKIGCYFGIGGVITYKNNKKLKEVVEYLDISRILFETDSPYLTPVPFRGDKNYPEYVMYVADQVALLKKINVDYLLDEVYKNTLALFDLKL